MATSGLRKLFQQSAKSLSFAGSSTNTTSLIKRRNQGTQFSAAVPKDVNETNNNNITEIEDNRDDRLLKVTFDNGSEHLYPHIFLRDHCQCSECFHPVTKSRKLNTVETVDLGIHISDVKYTDGAEGGDRKDAEGSCGKVTVTWPDNHESVFNADWLLSRAFPKDNNTVTEQGSTGMGEFPMLPWNKKVIDHQVPFVDYETLTKDDAELKQHLEHLFVYGFSVIRNAPDMDWDVLKNLAKLMCLSIITKTNYG